MRILNSNNKHIKFNHREFGNGKNVNLDRKEEKLYPCKVFLNKNKKAILVPKSKK